ncbi:hypothetical protein M8C21_025641 [Ambrosia artemisiifolia]|uniref:Uncharacterized protein n=1 Tax=Ambrosia artemisiifolia TaxID=4212 RepID=A0AAD5CUL3_AMBAR|nr:hypothetical protein M8C21_025641 [Ambrosia artemisiifolia]
MMTTVFPLSDSISSSEKMDKSSETKISSNGTHVTVQEIIECVNKEEHSRRRPSIYTVPSTIRDLRPNSFSPRVVSIGPLHREHENVQEFEGRKPYYLSTLMSDKSSLQQEVLQSCVEKAYTLMEDIRACYVWTKTYNDDEVAKMMVMDACFILGFILQIHDSSKRSGKRKNLVTQVIIYDLVLLENQIPFFFLEEIFGCTLSKFYPDVSLIKFLHPVLDHLRFFKGDINFQNISTNNTPHLLGLLHECYKPGDNDIPTSTLSSTIRSAIDLDRAGVHIRPNENPKWLMEMDVKVHRYPLFFWSWSKTTLKMPVLKVHHFSELVLRNLIAYEQFRRTSKYITSYVVAMDMLVNTQEDIAMLIDSEVLVNYMSSNEEAAYMINNIGKEVACEEFYYDEQWNTLNKYCNSYWPKHIARMRKTYFNSPWNMIALVAGIILFALTVVQTIFTIKPIGSNN